MTLKRSLLSSLNYFSWRSNQAEKFVGKADIAATSSGDVEYLLEGTTGPVIAAVHGEPGNVFQCGYIFAGLRSPNFRYLSWSRPGYLGTPLSSGRTIREQADLLYALLDYLNIDKVALIGFSFGGVVAMDFSIRYPSKTYALILDGAVASRISYTRTYYRYLMNFFSFSNTGNYFSSIIGNISGQTMLRSFIKHYSKLNSSEVGRVANEISKDHEMLQIVKANLTESVMPFSLNRKGFLNDAKSYSYLDSFEPHKISVPTLIIHGREDGEVPFQHGLLLSKSIKNSEFLPLKGGFHFTLLTHEKETVKAKFAFLSRHVFNNSLIGAHSKRKYNEKERNIFAVAEKIADTDANVLLICGIELYGIEDKYHLIMTIEVSSRLSLVKLKRITDKLKSKLLTSIPELSRVYIETMPGGYFASTVRADNQKF